MRRIIEKLKDGAFVKSMFYKLIGLLIMFAVAMLFLNILSDKSNGKNQIVSEGKTETDSFDDSVYKNDEELRLENILSGISGVGDVEVMISSNKSEESISVFESDSEQDEVDARGIVVLSSEADNPVVVTYIKEAVATAYDIDMSCIAVFKLRGNQG